MLFSKNKVNLNTADAGTLRELLLNDFQIDNLLKYRRLLGAFIDLHELQAIPGWDVDLIHRLLPYITLSTTVSPAVDFKNRFNDGQHTILLRAQSNIEKGTGYLRPDSILNRYPGSRQRLFLRYKYAYQNLLQYGITCDKDAGEQFFTGAQKKGFDFYSFHLFVRRTGNIKLLALGDFTVNLGQGLIHWQSLAFKKSADVLSVKRQADILRPYNAAGEYNFHRGAAVTIAKKAFEYTTFASIRNLDGNVRVDPFGEQYISSVVPSGYHRTPGELADRNQLHQTTFGGNLLYKHNSFRAGVNVVAYQFSKPIEKDQQPYNLYALKGKSWSNYSLDYSYTYRNIHLFGEAAIDKAGVPAVLQGAVISIDQKVGASLVYRNIPRNYHALYGNAFTEASVPGNERGLYCGLSIKPKTSIRIDAYADFFSSPWLRFRVDAPSKGSDYLLQVTYKPSKKVELYTRYRRETKAGNIYGLDQPIRPVDARIRQNWRTQLQVKSGQITFRNRNEFVWFTPEHKQLAEKGFSTYSDIMYKPPLKPYSFSTRLQYFETAGFESRVYNFETDVLYSFSIPFFSGKGLRYYVNLNYDFSKKLSCWLRVAQTIYRDQNTVGSALDEIPGNKKTDMKFQVLYNL